MPAVAHAGFPGEPDRPDPQRGPAAGSAGWDPALAAKEPPRGALQRQPSIGDAPARRTWVTRPIFRPPSETRGPVRPGTGLE